jgi:Fusaric acid resistance protein-like
MNILFINAYTNVHSLQKVYMGQPYGKTGLPSDWQRNFFHSITSINLGQLKMSAGIRIGIFIIALLAIGLISNHIGESILAILGTINISLVADAPQPKLSIMIRTLILVSIIDAFVFTIGSLIGLTDGYIGLPLFTLGLFIISYMGIYPNADRIVIVLSVIFSIGVSLPGINNIPIGERFLLLLSGCLWGTFGATIVPIILAKKKLISITKERDEKVQLSPVEHPSLSSFRHSIYLQTIKPLISNMSLRSGHFQFALSFAITGAIGLFIAQGLGIMRGYWILITMCVLLLRSDISVTFSFTSMRIIGTIIGAAIGVIIITNVVDSICALSFILFILASFFFAMRTVNYALATFFLTSFVLVLLDILIPGQTMLAQVRILDTLIGAGLTLVGVFILWLFSHLKKQDM